VSEHRLARAVVFDLDGTLIDSLADIAAAVNVTLVRHGFPTHPVDAFREFVGEGVEVLARKSLPPSAAGDPALITHVVEGYREAYHRTWDQETRPYPGIAELLDRLVSLRVPLAVLSNKPDAFTRLCVERLLDRWSFHPIFGERPGIPRKPDPAGAREIARTLGLDPSEIVYLGDTAVDIQTARAAGMVPVGVAWGFRSGDSLRQAGATILLERPEELLERFTFEPSQNRPAL
jgi:phosphoglycolate phosphatase